MKSYKYYFIGAITVLMSVFIFVQSDKHKQEKATAEQREAAILFDYKPEQVHRLVENVDIKQTEDEKVKSIAIKQAYSEDLTIFKTKMESLINLAKDSPEAVFSELLPDKDIGDNSLNYSKSIERNGITYKYTSIREFGLNFQIAKKEP